MKIARAQVKRLLGFEWLDLSLDSHLQLVAGPNNAGKSSLIRILEIFFSDPLGPELVELLPLNDYYTNLGHRTLSEITLWFSDLSEADKSNYSDLIRRDGLFWVSLRFSRAGTVSYQASKDGSAERARQAYEQILSVFHFVKVPSIRIGGTEQGGSESMERLLDTLEALLIRNGSSRSTAIQQEYAKRLTPVEDLVREVLDESAASIANDLPFQERIVKFRLPDSRHALRGMLLNTVIESHGNVELPVSQRGTGFQSALVLGILRYIAKRESSNGTNIFFAVEEPEAFLHPQTQRAMAKILRDIAGEGAQLLVTTHSSVLVDSYRIDQIVRLPLEPSGMNFTWDKPKFDAPTEGRLTRYCNASNSELLFANAVIFVEGESDFPVVEFLLGKVCGTPGGHYALGVTAIQAGGLGKIGILIELAQLFGVRSYVLADRDGLHISGGQRKLLTVLSAREDPIEPSVRNRICVESDTKSESLESAILRQSALNELLKPYDAFVLSADLEGMFLDSFGPVELAKALGPSGEGAIKKTFLDQLSAMPELEAYDQLASWLGSKGWNSDRKTSGKLEPHMSVKLLERWFEEHSHAHSTMAPLINWITEIVGSASTSPL